MSISLSFSSLTKNVFFSPCSCQSETCRAKNLSQKNDLLKKAMAGMWARPWSESGGNIVCLPYCWSNHGFKWARTACGHHLNEQEQWRVTYTRIHPDHTHVPMTCNTAHVQIEWIAITYRVQLPQNISGHLSHYKAFRWIFLFKMLLFLVKPNY